MKKLEISERVLRYLWKEQKFTRKLLKTIDGREVKVLSVGKSNPDGGPDFLNSKIYIGDTLFAGDVEIHLNINDWKVHQHHCDPKYDRVILHVVFAQPENLSTQYNIITKSKRIVPTLVLEHNISYRDIEEIHEKIFSEPVTDFQKLNCISINEKVDSIFLFNYLTKLSEERQEYKVRKMDERLKELIRFEKLNEPIIRYGKNFFEVYDDDLPIFEIELCTKDYSDIKYWEQLFYESIMESLGYTKNKLPFLKLAKILNLNLIKSLELPENNNQRVIFFEALLFKFSGLLPEYFNLKENETINQITIYQKYLSNIKINSSQLNAAEWQFFRLRPESFPTIRIAAGAAIIEKILSDSLFIKILKIISENKPECLQNLISLLSVKASDFWKNHYRFDKKTNKLIIQLLGKDKIIEIIINVVVPIFLLYARIFKKREVRENILKLFDSIKTSKSNYFVRKMDSNLVKGKINISNARTYQGLVQLYKFYCSENKCNECEIYKSLQKV